MTLDDLIAEGTALSRPSFLLTTDPTAGQSRVVAGYWGGERADLPSALSPEATQLTSRRHILTIDDELLRSVSIPAPRYPLSLFQTMDVRDREFHTIERGTLPFGELDCSGEPLYARPTRSFPPFEAICLYGGLKVATWLEALGLQRHQYAEAEAEALARQYTDEFLRRYPVYGEAADVVVGGWHMIWPDDDFYMPLEMRLTILTLRDAEPWIEVWHSLVTSNWSVQSRIT